MSEKKTFERVSPKLHYRLTIHAEKCQAAVKPEYRYRYLIFEEILKVIGSYILSLILVAIGLILIEASQDLPLFELLSDITGLMSIYLAVYGLWWMEDKTKQWPINLKSSSSPVEHLGYFNKLVERLQAWNEFMDTVQDAPVDEFGKMGEFALSYQERIKVLAEEWNAHLDTVEGATVLVTGIHHEIEQRIPQTDLDELRNITAMIRERDKVAMEKEFELLPTEAPGRKGKFPARKRKITDSS